MILGHQLNMRLEKEMEEIWDGSAWEIVIMMLEKHNSSKTEWPYNEFPDHKVKTVSLFLWLSPEYSLVSSMEDDK